MMTKSQYLTTFVVVADLKLGSYVVIF